jgi:ankyrin repeat protein
MQIETILGITDDSYKVNYDQLSAYLNFHHPNKIFVFDDELILFYAIRKHDLKLTQLLLKSGADVNYSGPNSPSHMTPLIYALYHENGNPSITDTRNKIINTILEYKPNLDTFDDFGDTALMTACWPTNDENIALTLIDLGANVHQITKPRVSEQCDNVIASICLRLTKNYSVQKKLIELGAHKTIIARTGASHELLWASDTNPYITRELVNAGANVYYKTSWITISNILQNPELSDIWKTVIEKIKEGDELPIFTRVISVNNKFVDKYISIDETKIFDNDFVAAAARNNYTRPIKRYLFDLLFGQFNRKKLNKYITNNIIAFICSA